jgi:hypothetical protein
LFDGSSGRGNSILVFSSDLVQNNLWAKSEIPNSLDWAKRDRWLCHHVAKSTIRAKSGLKVFASVLALGKCFLKENS